MEHREVLSSNVQEEVGENSENNTLSHQLLALGQNGYENAFQDNETLEAECNNSEQFDFEQCFSTLDSFEIPIKTV